MEPGLVVQLRTQSGSGRVRPQYDKEADILSITSSAPRAWLSGVDVSGTLIIDVDRDGVLANVDVVVPKRLWKVADLVLPDLVVQRADVAFAKETLARKSFALRVAVSINRQQSLVLVRIGNSAHVSRAVQLSERCIALLDRDVLSGFALGLTQSVPMAVR